LNLSNVLQASQRRLSRNCKTKKNRARFQWAGALIKLAFAAGAPGNGACTAVHSCGCGKVFARRVMALARRYTVAAVVKFLRAVNGACPTARYPTTATAVYR